MMDLLGIKVLRPGVSGEANAPNAANYDESKADVYTNLPDPLVLKSGEKVASEQMWWSKRRGEIQEDFDREILGRTPANLPQVLWEVMSTTREKNGDVPVVTKRLLGHVDNSAWPAITVDIDLTLTTPADAKGPVPVIMEFGFSREFMAAMAKRFPNGRSRYRFCVRMPRNITVIGLSGGSLVSTIESASSASRWIFT